VQFQFSGLINPEWCGSKSPGDRFKPVECFHIPLQAYADVPEGFRSGTGGEGLYRVKCRYYGAFLFERQQ
jgi:hypothetical protein